MDFCDRARTERYKAQREGLVSVIRNIDLGLLLWRDSEAESIDATAKWKKECQDGVTLMNATMRSIERNAILRSAAARLTD